VHTKRFLMLAVGIAATVLSSGAARAADLDTKAVSYTPVDKIQWRDNPAGTNQSAILYGDPRKPEPYAMLIRWKAGNMSRPHFHPNDRFFVVLSGTWWVGSGTKFDPEATVPMSAGTYVVHYGKGVHFDGAKQGDTVIMLHGMGPATSTPAEQK
jgi:ChrR-like protein with cupin domain